MGAPAHPEAPLDDGSPVRDEIGRILDGVTFASTSEEIAEAVARREAEDARNAATLTRLARGNASLHGWR